MKLPLVDCRLCAFHYTTTCRETAAPWVRICLQFEHDLGPAREARRYKHAEAFALMKYRDKVTGKIEIIWNSRDGVTPFIVLSTAGNESSHVNWRSDEVDPDHVPEVGDRIFVYLTEEDALEFQRRRFADNQDMAARLREHYGEDDETIIQKLVVGMMMPKGHPDVQVVTEEIRAIFENKD